jgi:hypothetical protein
MRTTTIALTLALAGCNSSCGPSKPAVNWPRIVACTEPAQFDLLQAVQGLLISPEPEEGDTTAIGTRAVQQLEQLARKHGENVVACLVDEAVRSFEGDASTGTSASGVIAAAPSASADVPAEPARKGMRAGPAQTLPEAIASDDQARYAAARGRDFLQRVAQTRVREGIAQ